MAMPLGGSNSVAVMMLQHARRSPAPHTTHTLINRFPAVLLLLPRRSSFLALPWLRPDHGIRFRLHAVMPNVNVRINVVGEAVAKQTVMGWPSRLNCSRQQLQWRRLSLMCKSRVPDVCASILFRSPWPVCPYLSVPSSSDGRSISGQLQWSSYSSVCKRSSSSATASVDSGDTQTIGELWEEYFADPFQWRDNRADKKNPRSPDLKHKVTKKALWIEGWSTPAWVKARLKPVSQGRLQCHTGYGIKDSQGTVQGRRLPKGNNGRRNTLPTSERELREIVQGGDGTKHLRSTSSTSDATAILKNVQHGITTDVYMYVADLKRCLNLKDFTAAKQIHDCIIRSGMEQNTYVANNILSAYIRCERLQDARRVFDGLLKKDVISWNIMIGGYAQHSHARDAMVVFHQMLQEHVQPNEITCLSILKACASPSALKWGKEVHAYIRHRGLESDVRVARALVHMCVRTGSIEDARLVFERMGERDVITWTVLIGGLAQYGRGHEAFELFLRMQRDGVKPDAVTYMSILNAGASAGALEWVKKVHMHILEAGLEKDLRVAGALVHMYAKSGNLDDARQVFDRMENCTVITWNIMIGGLANHGRGQEAYELFLRMQREGCAPNAVTYLSILNACASAGALEWVKDVHSHILGAGLEKDLRVGNALVHMYAKSGSLEDARQVFDRMEERDVITWNIMIGGLANHECGQEAYELFLRMQREGCVPNTVTYLSILNPCASAGSLEWVKDVHSHILAAGLEKDLRVGSALVQMYAKSGSIDDARLVFDRMDERNVITWNIMIGGLAQHGHGHEALELFRKMDADGVKPDECLFVAVLSACSHAGLVDEGRRLFSVILQDYGIKPNVLHCNCMVDLLGRGGHLEEAKCFIDNMPVEPNGATWGALLGACRSHGNVELGELAANEVFKLQPKDASPYVLLSNIYAAAGKWEEVSLVRTLMQERGIRKEAGRSWIEVDNKLHEFVVGDLSHPEAKEIHAELNRLTELIKAKGYIPDTRLVLKNIEEEDKEQALCSHSERLAIAFGLMHTPRGKPIRVYKNLRVCSDCHTATKFISKVTGREIVARDANRFHHFKDGVCSCGDYW